MNTAFPLSVFLIACDRGSVQSVPLYININEIAEIEGLDKVDH